MNPDPETRLRAILAQCPRVFFGTAAELMQWAADELDRRQAAVEAIEAAYDAVNREQRRLRLEVQRLREDLGEIHKPRYVGD